MKVICAFDDLTNFVHTILLQIHLVLANSKVFLQHVSTFFKLWSYKSLKSYMDTFLRMILPD